MNFYTHQDNARKHTSYLICLFMLAVITLITITNLMIATFYWAIHYNKAVFSVQLTPWQLIGQLGWETFLSINLSIIMVIMGAIFLKWRSLSAGGSSVAVALGGRVLCASTANTKERRLLNVVEEMAIAAGMPVPLVYLLESEPAINAFAAGRTPADAVIGVSKGSLDQLNREQLQGVIAHEFSHILNGDMSLNIKLIAILNGILFIGLMGQWLTRGSYYRGYSCQRRSSTNQLALLGLGFIVVGWLGSFFGRWIKFADALKIIGGYSAGTKVRHARTEEFSHLFFGNALQYFDGFMSTHPPLADRIRRIQKNWDGKYIARNHREPTRDKDVQAENVTITPQEALLTTAILAGSTLNTHQAPTAIARQLLTGIPDSIHQQTLDRFDATALIFSLLLDDNPDILNKQIKIIENTRFLGLSIQAQHCQQDIKTLDELQKIPLVELCIPALKTLSEPQYKTVKKALLLLIQADKNTNLFEWCLFKLVCHYVETELNIIKPSRPTFKTATPVERDYQQVLSTLAWYGQDQQTEEDVAKNFYRGANTTGLYRITLLAKKDCQIRKLSAALDKLANCYPLVKPKLLKGLIDCAKHDDRITAQEQGIIRTVAAIIDCPISPANKL